MSWEEVCAKSSKVISFIDLAGHERYLKTTVFGMTGCLPDFVMLMSDANAGLIGMSKRSISVSHSLCPCRGCLHYQNRHDASSRPRDNAQAAHQDSQVARLPEDARLHQRYGSGGRVRPSSRVGAYLSQSSNLQCHWSESRPLAQFPQYLATGQRSQIPG